jgi:hypothetical protein
MMVVGAHPGAGGDAPARHPACAPGQARVAHSRAVAVDLPAVGRRGDCTGGVKFAEHLRADPAQ